MKIPLGGTVITSLKKILSFSGKVLVVTGISSGCFASEANTASNVLNDLLKTTAGAITQNQQQAQPAQAQQQITSTPAENTQATDATALPIFDNPAGSEPSTAAAATASTGIETNSPTTTQSNVVIQPTALSATASVTPQPTSALDQSGTLARSPVASAPITAASQSVSVQAMPVQQTSSSQIVSEQSPITTAIADMATQMKKRVGFVSQNGIVLIAPDDVVFPLEMQDEGIYIFSRDIDAFKKKIASGEVTFPTVTQSVPQPTAAAPEQQTPVAQQQVPTAAAVPNTQVPTALQQSSTAGQQNDCQGCHVWLKTAI